MISEIREDDHNDNLTFFSCSVVKITPTHTHTLGLIKTEKSFSLTAGNKTCDDTQLSPQFINTVS